jgi:hypothetical protein
MLMNHNRIDASQPAIVQRLRAWGGYWFDLVPNRQAGCDGIALFRGAMAAVEIKDGDKPPSARLLTANELATQHNVQECGGTYLVWQSPADVDTWTASVLERNQARNDNAT